MLNFRNIIKQLMPPFIVEMIRALKRRGNTEEKEWTWEREGWDSPRSRRVGWDHSSIADAYQQRLPPFLASLREPLPLGRPFEAPGEWVPSLGVQNTHLHFAYALGLSLCGGARLRVLDWGGGAAHYLALAQALYPSCDFDWHCAELPHIVDKVRYLMPCAVFHDEASWQELPYDLVFCSSSLQYVEKIDEVIESLCRPRAQWLMITRIPTCQKVPSYVLRQNPRRYGYDTDYLGWVFNENQLCALLQQHGYHLRRIFILDEAPHCPEAPEPPIYRGYLFSTTSSLSL